MMRKVLTLISVSLLLLGIAGCGGGGEENEGDETGVESTVGNAANGEELYKKTVIGSASAPGCITCHSLEAEVTLIGPSHATIGAEADGRVTGLTAEEYLRQSILDPNANVTEGFVAGVMYPNYGNELTEQEITDLVVFMLTLK